MTLKISHHPDPATLMSFAAGTLCGALASVVSAHVEMCPQCHEEVRDLDMVGAALLQAIPASAAGKVAVPQHSRTVVDLVPKRSAVRDERPRGALPVAFAKRIGVDLGSVPWRRLAPGILHHRVNLAPGSKGDLRLLKIAAGKRMPEHGHGGTELTLVLDGAYADGTGRYRCGDIQDIDSDLEHRPVADDKLGCICIIASEQPARYKSLINRLLQPLTGI